MISIISAANAASMARNRLEGAFIDIDAAIRSAAKTGNVGCSYKFTGSQVDTKIIRAELESKGYDVQVCRIKDTDPRASGESNEFRFNILWESSLRQS